MRGGGVIFRRELAAFFLSPVGAVIGAAFLAVQGLSFWGLIRVLANPAMPAPYGSVLSSYFGGTVIYWAILFALTAALTMRLFAEEKRSGTWETLCTSGVSDAAVIAGKLGAAYATYLLLWIPTVVFVAIVFVFAPSDAAIDVGPIATAYLGVAVVGTALITVGGLASALTDKQMVAALISFVVAIAALLIGEITGAGISARADSFELASGLVRLGTVASYVAIAMVALFAIHAALAVGRRGRREVVRRALLAVAIAACSGAVAVLAGRAPSLDVTSSKIHTLEAETRAVLDRVKAPLEVLVIKPTIPGFADVFEAIGRVLERFGESQPLISVTWIDPADGGSDVASLARQFGVSAEPLRQGGGVVFQLGPRRRLLDVTAVATFEDDPLGAAKMATFWAESAFAEAIAEITDDRPHVVCAAKDLGGLPLRSSGADGLDWSGVAEILRRDGLTLRAVSVSSGVSGCDALAIIGPGQRLSARGALVVSRYLAGGGSLMVAVRSEREDLAPGLGLELVLAEHGLAIGASVVVDPGAEIGVANLWKTTRGYGDHPITRPFARRDVATTWPAPRSVSVSSGVALVFGSDKSWAESDVASVFSGDAIAADAGERLGSVPVAAAVVTKGGGRIVVLGSAEAAASQFVARGLGAGHILAARSLRWLVGRDVDVAISDKSPEHVRLLMSPAMLWAVFVIGVIAVPLVWLLVFVVVLVRRRRG